MKLRLLIIAILLLPSAATWADERTFTVEAHLDCPWKLTPIYEADCDAMFSFPSLGGTVTLGAGNACSVDPCGRIVGGSQPDCVPDEFMPICDEGCPLLGAPKGCLIVKIDDAIQPVSACRLSAQFPIRAGQKLYVGINDAECSDNSGAFGGLLVIEPQASRSIDLLYPDDHFVWNAGDVETIMWEWEPRCTHDDSRIELNRNYPGGTWVEIATVPYADDFGLYQWTVTGPATTNARVRVSGVTHPEAYDVSAADFEIVAPSSEGWTVQSSGTSANLFGVSFVDAYDGWAVGASGTILHTTNGGATWTSQNSGTGCGLSQVDFVDMNNGWAAGDCILHTSNAGVTWNTQSSGYTCYGLDFVDLNNGWAVGGGNILHTSNGGATWTLQQTGQNSFLCGVAFVDNNNGWAVADLTSQISHTTNGGVTWMLQNTGATANMRELDFVDLSNGWIAGRGAISYTSNGGANWTTQSNWIVEDVDFVDASNGWAVGDGGTIVHTTNGGRTWTPQQSESGSYLEGVAFVDAHNGWVVGNGGTILHNGSLPPPPSIHVIAPDGGETWLVSDSRTIAWTSQGMNNENVHIEYNRGPGWWDIATVANSGSYSWNVAGPASNTVRVRVTGTVHTSVSDESDADFTIGDRTVNVTSPNGSESWFTEDTHDITWTYQYLTENVKIEINRLWPSGSWETIVSSTPNDGLYSWRVSGSSTTTARIRVSGIFHPLASDMSDNNFTVTQRSLTLETPNGDDEWWVGSQPFVTWNSHSVPGSIAIELNRNYPFGTWERIGTASAGHEIFMWTVTGIGSSNARIRITSLTYPSLQDVSDASFSIFSPPLIQHDPHADQLPGTATFLANVTDDLPGTETKVFYQSSGGSGYDSLTMTPTGTANEFFATTAALASGRYEYFLRSTDSQGISTYNPVFGAYKFDLGFYGSDWLGCDDGTAENYNWIDVPEFSWAVKFVPPAFPFILSAARFAVCPTCPDSMHDAVVFKIHLADGPGDFPGSIVFEDTTGSIGNLIESVPGGVVWVDVITRINGESMVLDRPFYVSVENSGQPAHPNAFGLDTTGGRCHASYFWDACEQVWHNEDDASANARPGNRMIRVNGYPLAAPAVVIYLAADTLRLAWTNEHAPSYSVYAASDAAGGYSFVQSTADTFFTVGAVDAAATRMYYQVQTATAP